MADFDAEVNSMVAEDDTPLGETIPIGELGDEFGDLKDINNFDYLGDGDGSPAGEGEEGESLDPPEKDPTQVEAKTEEPKAEEKSAEVDVQSAEKLAAYDRLDKALREKPAEAVKAILAGMSIQDRTALAQELSGEAPKQAEQFNLEEYETQSDMEDAIKSRWGSIESIPQIIQAQNEAGRKMEQGFATFVPHVTDANVASQIVWAKIDALCEALGIELPDPDGEAILKTLQTGKSTYRDAVRQSTNYKGQIDAHKQTRRPRPETPGGSARNVEPIKAGTGAVEIARRLGHLPPR